jgi:hypothetical protein
MLQHDSSMVRAGEYSVFPDCGSMMKPHWKLLKWLLFMRNDPAVGVFFRDSQAVKSWHCF